MTSVDENKRSDHPISGVVLNRKHLVDWTAACSCVFLVLCSALMLANGSCSKPHGLSADIPMYIGGQLSIQAWLAIIGIEFSITSSFLLPKLLSVSISKSLTSSTTSKGIPLSKILNSQSTAPITTQLHHGWKSIFTARAVMSLFIAAITVLYKFSFVLVNHQGTMQVAADWVEMGTSPSPPGKCPTKVYPQWPVDGSAFDYNYRDLTSNSNNSILFTGPKWSANETSGPSTLYVGPAINITSVPQLLNGTVSRCVPAAFSKFTLSTAPAPSPWSVAYAPFAADGRVLNSSINIAFRGDSNGTLSILPFTSPVRSKDPMYGSGYNFIVTAQVQNCWGNFSWTNTRGYQVFEMSEPVDTICLPRDFTNYTDPFSGSYTWPYAQSIIQAYEAGHPSLLYGQPNNDYSITLAIQLFLLALPAATGAPSTGQAKIPEPGSIMPSNPALKALCDRGVKKYNDGPCPFTASTVAFITGTIDKRGVGITSLGMALQAIVLFSSLATLFVLLGPGLPILTEWSAQWLGLVSGMSDGELVGNVTGTSTGRGYVEDQTRVYLSSIVEPGDQNKAYLKLTKEGGEICWGIEHL